MGADYFEHIKHHREAIILCLESGKRKKIITLAGRRYVFFTYALSLFFPILLKRAFRSRFLKPSI